MELILGAISGNTSHIFGMRIHNWLKPSVSTDVIIPFEMISSASLTMGSSMDGFSLSKNVSNAFVI